VRAFQAIAHDLAVTRKELPVRECLDCGLAWQYPRQRTADESAEKLSQRYAEQQEDSYFDPERRGAVVQSELAFLHSLFDSPSRLLDVGAGDGTFIAHAAARGWTCVGVDPAARLNPSLPSSGPGTFELVRGTLDDLSDGAKFDAVTMWDVIEHLDEPEGVLSGVVRLLKDDGVLIIETGNYQSADRVESGPDWWCYAADHRWYFGPPTIRLLLQRLGFAHVALAATVLRPWWHGKAAYAGPSRLRTLKKVVRQPLKALGILGQHRTLSAGAAAWKGWGGLGIVAIAASRRPIAVHNGTTQLLKVD